MELQDVVNNPETAMILALWVNRFHNPELAVQITPDEISQFEACVDYLKVKPRLRIVHPEGRRGHPEIPAAGNRRAVPAMEDEPPKPYVMVQVVDQDGNAFKPIESTEEGAKQRDRTMEMDRARNNARQLADALTAGAQVGMFSTDTILEAAATLRALA